MSEMSDFQSAVVLAFRDGNRVLAEMTLAAENDSDSECASMPNIVPEYLIRDRSLNIPCVSDIDDIDGYSPLMVYLGGNANLSPLLLLEETDYELRLSGKVDSAFDYLIGNGGDIVLRKIGLCGSDIDQYYTLSFKGYVGKGYFDIVSEGKKYSIPFEVRSKKIDYFRQYPLMIGDIAEFSVALLLGIKSPLHSSFTLDNVSNDTLYEEFMLLDYVFSKKNLLGAYAQICNNKHCELNSVSEPVPAGMAWDIDPSDLTSLIVSDNLCPLENGPIAEKFAPIIVAERNYIDNYDAPENRLVKDLILTVQKMAYRLRSNPLSNGSSYISGRVSEMCSDIDFIASDPWLNTVGPLEGIPYSSTVLQCRSGYMELFSIYQVLGLGIAFRQDDMEDLVKGQNNKVYQVYEYWCYTRLYKCLYGLSENKPAFPLTKSDGRWVMTIRRGNTVRFRVPLAERYADIDLYYNETFNSDRQGFRSYSVALRPDFTLIVHLDSERGSRYIINFDAKYKVKVKDSSRAVVPDSEINSDCWEYDIYKMHTYRDALMQSYGSYVLYPGEKDVLYPKPPSEADWSDRKNIVIPSVGAIPLIPGSEKDVYLEETLISILTALMGPFKGEMDIGH